MQAASHPNEGRSSNKAVVTPKGVVGSKRAKPVAPVRWCRHKEVRESGMGTSPAGRIQLTQEADTSGSRRAHFGVGKPET